MAEQSPAEWRHLGRRGHAQVGDEFRFLTKLSFRFRPEGVGNSKYFINRPAFRYIEFN